MKNKLCSWDDGRYRFPLSCNPASCRILDQNMDRSVIDAGVGRTSTQPGLNVTTESKSKLRTSMGSFHSTLPYLRWATLKLATDSRDSGSSRAIAASCVRLGSICRLLSEMVGSSSETYRRNKLILCHSNNACIKLTA